MGEDEADVLILGAGLSGIGAACRLRQGVVKTLGENYPVDEHFNPSYNPFDQRICFVPDGDMFSALKSGKTEVVTDHIETFTPTGIKLKSGKQLEADIMVAATGFKEFA